MPPAPYQPAVGLPPAIADWRAYARVMPYVRPYSGRLTIVLLISLVATASGLAQPYLSKLMIDDALLKGDMQMLVWISGAMIAVTLGGYCLNMAASYRHVTLSAAMLYDIRVALLRHLQTLSPRFYDSFRLGDLMSRINSDVSDVQRAAGDTALSALTNVLFLIGCVALMAWLNWRLFLVGIVIVPFAVMSFLHLQRKVTDLTLTMRERGADLGSFLVDTVMGMRVITTLNAQEHETQRFTGHNQRFVDTMLRMQLASFMTGAVPGTLLAVSTSAVTLYGGWQIFRGEMTIGTLVAFMAYQMRLFGPIQSLLGIAATLASTRVALARIFALFDTPADVTEAPNPVPLGPVTVGITLDAVSFRHDRDTVLDAVSVTIPAGCFCAILGESGAGKSTLVDLIVRVQDPQSGTVMIDGKDLRTVALADLRRQVLLVDQMPHLFNRSIAENIAFGLDSIPTDRIAAAADAAGLAPALARFPQGLDTPVGERGQALSAGERQRVALARALLRDPSVLILDEPSSALDAVTEDRILRGIRGALPHATIIVITHKPAFAERADLVLTVANGQVATMSIGSLQ